MTEAEALKLLRGGKKGIVEWNRRRAAGEEIPSLRGAYLNGAILSDANLRHANLSHANLSEANLRGAYLRGDDLSHANLIMANLSHANLREANLNGAGLHGADLSRTDLVDASFSRCILAATKFANAAWGWTALADMDLREAKGLDTARFNGPSSIGVDTLDRSAGQIPESFLRGCGFQPWQVIQSKTYDPNLTRDEFTDLLYKMDVARNQGPLFIGGVFISYSHDDTGFVDKMHDRLEEEGASVWLDRHDMIAGALQKQVSRAIRLNDVVLLVLSESSVNSAWVEHELEMALKKEKEEGRDVLCPVALHDAWKAKMDDVLWRQVKKKHVLDFSEWETDAAFDSVYQKLTAGLKINYEPAAGGSATGAT